ncbi:DUF1116 domain-containing protein [Acidaminobacter sp.]|uniref:DUF1116 domain-containing protein n=1 Tax=Acidaminobacter sp. TaxID=1872102 RepID=UPI001382E5B5|nr:DUF1116 domain-containing protein [Acidaminobacter sp.]MDK9709925.1 DUF1116 domain-containing protein [Acidaminobacter sp.]MZQ97436.1 DUF1116 domain-containing protein [Acidaminobacter sp.]
MNPNIQAANEEALKRINEGMPVLVDIKFAHEVLPGMRKNIIGHSGPPIDWEDMCGPMKGAIVGVIKYEGLAENDEEAVKLVEEGGVEFVSNHSMGAVGPMTGMISYSMPLYEVKNETFGNYAYSTFNEGLGKVMRFGANNEEVLERLRFMETSLAPALKKALTHTGPLNIRVLMSEALAMGDEMHQRNIAASLLFGKTVLPAISRVVEDVEERFRITSFITDNKQFFLNLCMAAGKAMMDPVKNIEGSTVVTAMSRNGTNFGIKVSGLGDEWFEAPVNMPKGLYFPGYSESDANPDMGDSTIVETIGLGGFTMGAAPAVVRFVGAASVEAALNYSRDMMEITVGQSPSLLMPTMNFEGAPTGIDIRKVVETGILPVINTGMAHKEPGIGQIGAGIVEAPLECFIKAVLRYSEVYNI